MARSIMIQGTTSGAGKSFLVAGLCRFLRRQGYRVAPFKSQNMSLNSYVTADGLEMARSQVMQAQGAGIEPDVRMNPVLLKPNSDTGSQVIVNGEAVGNMTAAQYFGWKKTLIPVIQAAYRSLAEEYDVIVLEGAGSPAEINLKQEDIVNMGMAKMAGAPVLLVGDIHPGGVFASLAGTFQLLQPWERAHIRGVIINKFRGDPEILKPGLSLLEGILHKPVVGVVPWMEVDLDEEDSLSHRLEGKAGGLIDIAVVRLPRMANFTDFSALTAMGEVGLRYVEKPGLLGDPDLLILPGTKNTMGDMDWLRQSGMEAKILAYAGGGRPVLGICGGFQMMGERLKDPENLEQGGEMAGLGFFDAITTFCPHKNRAQVTGCLGELGGILAPLSGERFSGYEIHMGETEGTGVPFALVDTPASPRPEGACAGNLYGSYVHGLLDASGVCEKLVRALMEAKGLSGEGIGAVRTAAYRERQFDLLADGLEASLNTQHILDIIRGN